MPDQDRIGGVEAIFRDAGYEIVFEPPKSDGGEWGADGVPLPPRNNPLVLTLGGVGPTKLAAAEAILADLRRKQA